MRRHYIPAARARRYPPVFARLSARSPHPLTPSLFVDARLHHLAPDTERFAALMQRRSLAGLHFEPLPPLKVRDRYLDTPSGALLAAGWTLRLRAQDGSGLASLRPLDGSEEGLGQTVDPDTEALPIGPVRAAAVALAGPEPLDPLVALRQYRTPRAIYDGRRLVGVLSLDVVTDDLGDVPESWHEVETKMAQGGTLRDLRRLNTELRDLGFSTLPRTKFERALFRVGRDADGPLLLLPDERAALEDLRTSTSSLARRRAEVVLLAAEGLPTRKISYKASLSPSRVRHWKHAFRHDRMDIFDMDEPEPELAPEELDAPGFRVSEIVEPGETPPPRVSPIEDITTIFDEVMDGALRDPGTPFLRGDDGDNPDPSLT